MSNKPSAPSDIESSPDAWEKFERAVDTVVKAPPQHKVSAKKQPKKDSEDGGPLSAAKPSKEGR
jgi:hypothetical protein